jgi:DNA gyrase/topoisomerase IV subunit B
MTSSAPTPLRQLIENRLSQLTAETETLFADARERARRETADQLNQAVRRIRQADNLDDLCATLADAAGSLAAGVILFRVDGDSATSERLDVSLSAAAALRGAIETRDPVIAAATAGEVSPALLEILGQPADGRIFIFPVVVGDAVPALLCAWSEVQGSSVELLTQVAAAAWSAVAPPPPPPPPVESLITIAPAPEPAAVAVPEASPAAAWDLLSPDQQQTHLRAQRFARVQAAEMRLFSPDAVHSGRERRDLYEALREPIENARTAFRTRFFAACPSMVDYLHLELVRTLANDDPELLGKNYPGPMA